MALILTFRNISKLAEWSDYDYQVLINRRVLESGKVLSHSRALGWEALVERFLKERQITLHP